MDPSASPRSAVEYERLSSSPSTSLSDSPPNRAQPQSQQQQPAPQSQPQTVPSLTTEELEAVKRAVGSTASVRHTTNTARRELLQRCCVLQSRSLLSIAAHLFSRQVLASVVAKLYLCPAGSPSFAWTGLWGACVLVVDRSRSNPSKHIQMWSLHTYAAAAAAAAGSNSDSAPSPAPPQPTLDRTLNVQLYEGLEYLCLHPLFHAFESDNVVIGLSFGHAAEAAEFCTKVREHVPAIGTAPRAPVRKASLLQRISGIFSSSPAASAAGASTPPPSGSPKEGASSSGSLSPLVGGSTLNASSAAAAPAGPSISPPQGFVHHAHATFSSDGLLVAGGNLPIEWHGLFENAQQHIVAQKARERGSSQNSSSATPNQPAQSGGNTPAAGSVQGSPVSQSHSEGSPAAATSASHPHQRQLSHHASWTPTHNPNPSPRA